MSNKHLYIFTLQFPYGNGESFLAPELPFLSKAFDKVTIVPRDRAGNIRDISEIEVDDSFSRSIPNGVSMLFRIVWLLLTEGSIYKEIYYKPCLLKSIKSIKLLLYYTVINHVIRKWARDKKDVVFYTYWIESFTYGLCQLEQNGNRMVSRAHRYDLYEADFSRPYLPYRREIYQSIDQIHTISDHGFQYLNQQNGLKKSKIFLSRLGTFEPKSLCKASSNDCFRILSLSDVRVVKRIELIIAGIESLSKRLDIKIIWTHIGDGEEMNEIQRLAKARLEGKVDYQFFGALPNNRVFEYYKDNAVDAFVNTSSIEGIPVTFMEAMSFGVPVVGTNVGGVSEILNETNGVLLPPDPDGDRVAEALLLIATSGNNMSLRAGARKTWEKKFNANDNYTKFITEILNEINY